MSKFFKKIGRSFRKLGRGLNKFFKSKIGKVLGTFMLAVSLPAIFNAFFTGGVTTGTGAGTVTKIGETTVAAGADVAETLGTVAEIKEAKDAINLGTRLGAALKQTGEIFMSPIDATKRSFDALWGRSPEMLTGEIMESEHYKKVGDVAINISEEGALSDSKVSNMIKEMNVEDANIDDVIKRVSEERGIAVPDVYKQEQITFMENQKATPTDIINYEMGDDTLIKQSEFHNVWSGMSQKQRSRFLRDRAGREYYEDLFGYSTAESKGVPGLSTLMKAPGTFKGVQPFSSIRDAWQEGKGLGKVGNVIGQVVDAPVAKAIPGYEGIGADSSIYTAGKTLVAAHSLLAPEEQIKGSSSSYNYTASAMAKQNLEVADALTSAQPSNSINLYDYAAQDMGDQNSLQIHQKILSDAGYGYGYGPNSVNTV
jgi:hypothetical protein